MDKVKEQIKQSEYIYITQYGMPKDFLMFGKRKQNILKISTTEDVIELRTNSFVFFAGQFWDTWLTFNYNDYGLTWAFTEEELTKDN